MGPTREKAHLAPALFRQMLRDFEEDPGYPGRTAEKNLLQKGSLKVRSLQAIWRRKEVRGAGTEDICSVHERLEERLLRAEGAVENEDCSQ